MGSALVRMVRDAQGMVVSGGTERPGGAMIGLDVGLAARVGTLEVSVMDDLRALLEMTPSDVVIDFTSPEASVEHARICAARKVALVVGSTGFSSAAKAQVAQAGDRIAVVMAPNMSVGVNLVIQVAGHLARVLGEDYDCEIMEMHHRLKKDAPSGTALRLAAEVAEATGRSSKDFLTAREGQVGERRDGEIGIQALRGGDVVGEHTVFFLGDGERVELTHRASKRETFASGALRAARWVALQKPGLYDMQDVLGLSR